MGPVNDEFISFYLRLCCSYNIHIKPCLTSTRNESSRKIL